MPLDPITPAQQETILANVRELVPDAAKGRSDRRHTLMLGVVLGLQAIDHGCVPPHWLMNILAGRTDRLFPKKGN